MKTSKLKIEDFTANCLSKKGAISILGGLGDTYGTPIPPNLPGGGGAVPIGPTPPPPGPLQG